MKQGLTAILLGLFVAVVAQAANAPDFRQTTWRMTVAQVKSLEKAELLSEEKDNLVYSGSVANLNCAILYYFIEDKLYRGGYFITEQYIDANKYINNYDNLKELLRGKYGKPSNDQTTWSNDLFRNDPSTWGTAVAMGYLTFMCTWDLEKTEIDLILSGDNLETRLIIVYGSKELAPLVEEAEKARASEGL